MFTTREIDDLCEFVLRSVARAGTTAEGAARALVARIASSDPDAPALGPVLPLAMAAAALETMLDDESDRRAAATLWRAAALIAAEVLALQVQAGVAAGPTVGQLRARFGQDAEAGSEAVG